MCLSVCSEAADNNETAGENAQPVVVQQRFGDGQINHFKPDSSPVQTAEQTFWLIKRNSTHRWPRSGVKPLRRWPASKPPTGDFNQDEWTACWGFPPALSNPLLPASAYWSAHWFHLVATRVPLPFWHFKALPNLVMLLPQVPQLQSNGKKHEGFLCGRRALRHDFTPFYTPTRLESPPICRPEQIFQPRDNWVFLSCL